MIEKIIEKAKSQNKIVYIYAHKFPDGDAINSSCAVVEYLKSHGIKSKYVVTRDIKQDDSIIPPTKFVEKNSVSIILDTNSVCYAENRLFTYSKPENIYVIDHHQKANDTKCIEDELNIPSENVIRDSNSSSTCEILVNEFDREKVSPNIANMLTSGLLSDTGKLRFLKSDTLLNLSKLLEIGADYEEISKSSNRKSYLNNEVGLAKILLSTKKFDIGNTFGIIASVNNQQANSYIKSHGLRNIQKKIFKMSDIENCSFNCMIAEIFPGQYEVEFRSNTVYGDFNVFDLAKELGGGGHPYASGCTIKSKNPIEDTLVETIQSKYTSYHSTTTPILSNSDLELSKILDSTDRLTKNVSTEILSRVDELVKNGANYEYVFKKYKTFERFMLENEILSKVPEDKLFEPMPSLNINLSSQDLSTLMQKYNTSERDILDIISVFSDISITSASISLPNGKKSHIDKNGNISFSDEVIKNKDKEDISL